MGSEGNEFFNKSEIESQHTDDKSTPEPVLGDRQTCTRSIHNLRIRGINSSVVFLEVDGMKTDQKN